MKFPHFVRCLVCFLLIFALLVNVSPLKADAASIVYSKVAIDSLTVVGSVIMGLGVLAGADTSVFKSLASSVVSAIGLGNIIDVVTWVASGGAYKYAIPQTLVQKVSDYLWSSSVLSSVESQSAKLTTAEKTALKNAQKKPYYFLAFDSNGNAVIGSHDTHPFVITSGTSGLVVKSAGGGGVGFPCYCASWSGTLTKYSVPIVSGNVYVTGQEAVNLSDNYTPGFIASYGSAVASGYADWYANSVVVPGTITGSSDDDDEEVHLPFAPGRNWDDTIGKTQDDVWNGSGTYEGSSEGDSSAGSGSSASSISQTWLGQKLDSLVASISGFFSNVISAVQAIPSAFSNWFDQIIELLRGLAGVISDALVEALSLVFALDSEYVQSEVNKMTSDFVFLGSMVDFGRGLVDIFYGIGSKPPVLYVDLHDAEGDIVWGDRVVFLDLTWYERYKPYGDAIISSFLWAWFGWRLLHNIPGLLNGTSGAVPSSSVFRSWGG